jgi:2-oxoglutarate dehydrogenase E1 component
MARDPFLEAGLANPDVVDDYYRQFLKDPNSLDASWVTLFNDFENQVKAAKDIIDEKLPSLDTQITSTDKKLLLREKNLLLREKGLLLKEEEFLLKTVAKTVEENKTPKQEAPRESKSLQKVVVEEEKVEMELEELEEEIIEYAAEDENDSHETPNLADMRLYNLIQAYRNYGHRMASVNPLVEKKPKMLRRLDIKTWGFSRKDLSKFFPTCDLMAKPEATLKEIIEVLQDVYCSKIGLEYMGLQKGIMEKWIQEQIEPTRLTPNLDIEEKKTILNSLNRSELFEVFLHTKYVGQKRFSLEGGETLIPMLNSLINKGADEGVEQFAIGMAHRGRLNVLANILNKSYTEVFSEFEENYIQGSCEGSGDVKYHKGFESKITTPSGKEVGVVLAANPSHLEAVGAVVNGKVRARQVLSQDDVEMKRVVPIIIHGDAAVAGQGIIYELLQLYRLPGYSTGGSLHIVVNNQIGFTTLPKDARSTFYCTDVAKGFCAPVIHVNAEDPEGCVFAIKLALDIRQKFHCDVFVELNCYRKFGHNEGDEPAFTQPLEYKMIKKKSSIREVYRSSLINQGVMEKAVAEMLEEEFKNSLQEALKSGKLRADAKKIDHINEEKEERLSSARQQIFEKTLTKLPIELLQSLSEKFCKIPKDFNLHRKLKRLLNDRLEMLKGDVNEAKIDWGMGEHLAFASLLWEQFHVRLSGQDSRRGTFSHRHAMWIDQETAEKFFPLSSLRKDQGRFDVFNSPLSEYAVLGFEFGYSLDFPASLVIWEAQFGDFCNGAQIIIDQFIATSEQKWGSKSRLALFLPHGYEGQGPEHSSGRIERFLQLAGDYNMQICNASNPAQFFHLLRRQVLQPLAKPLIVFTPKGLLRHPLCVSPVKDFTEGRFEEILDDQQGYEKAERLLFCSGAVYYELLKERDKQKRKDIAIIRVEQLYPLHKERIKEIIGNYKWAEEFFWVQEEACNMGAWDFIHPQLEEILPKGKSLEYVGRQRSASPAVGSYALHSREVTKILADAFHRKGKPFHEIAVNQGVRG